MVSTKLYEIIIIIIILCVKSFITVDVLNITACPVGLACLLGTFLGPALN